MDEREITISGADWSFTVTSRVGPFSDDVMAEAMAWKAREFEIGFPMTPPTKRGDVVTITVPQWEFQVRAKVLSVGDRIVRLREVRGDRHG